MIAPKTSISERPHRATFQNPGPAVPDGDGGSAQSWTDLVPPSLSVRISPATAVDLERVAAGTVLSTNTYIVKGPYHPQVTTQTRMLYDGRMFSVTGGGSPDERKVEMELVAVEIVS